MKHMNCCALGIFLSLLLLGCGKSPVIQQGKGPLPEKKGKRTNFKCIA